MKAAQQQVSTPSNNGSNGGGNGGGGPGPGHMLGGPGGANTPSIASPPPSGGLLGGECYKRYYSLRLFFVVFASLSETKKKKNQKKNTLHRVTYAQRNTFKVFFAFSFAPLKRQLRSPLRHRANTTTCFDRRSTDTLLLLIFYFNVNSFCRLFSGNRFSGRQSNRPDFRTITTTPHPLPGNAVYGLADSVRKSFVSHRVAVASPAVLLVSSGVPEEDSGGDDGYAQTRVGRVS